MVKIPFISNNKKKKNKKSAARVAAEARAQRREQALKTGFVSHPEVEKEYRRKRFFVQYEKLIRAGIFVGIGLLVLLIIGAITLIVIRNLPGRDDDRDGVLNTEDVCPGFDDNLDGDDDGVPDGCEEIPPTPEVTVEGAEIISVGEDRYDVAVRVSNPNQEWGVSPLKYNIHLLASDGSVINSSPRQDAFLLPSQEKYLLAFNILAVQAPARAELAVTSADWLKVQNYIPPRLDTSTVSYEELDEPGQFASLKGRTINRTNFIFDDIQVIILLRGENDEIVALNRSEVDTLQPGEERDFIVTFPFELPTVNADNITYETDVDVFSNESFVRASVVKGQRFQQFTPQSPR